jgi:hypothetical protein
VTLAEPAGLAAPSSEGAAAIAAEELEVPQAGIGWLRAIGSGLAVLVVGFGLAVGVANWILTDGLGLKSRDERVWLASAVFFFVVVVAAWGLRRLQSRGLI